MIVSFILFLVLVFFGDEVIKILYNLCLHFSRQDGKDKKMMESKSHNESDQNTKKTRDDNMG